MPPKNECFSHAWHCKLLSVSKHFSMLKWKWKWKTNTIACMWCLNWFTWDDFMLSHSMHSNGNWISFFANITQTDDRSNCILVYFPILLLNRNQHKYLNQIFRFHFTLLKNASSFLWAGSIVGLFWKCLKKTVQMAGIVTESGHAQFHMLF